VQLTLAASPFTACANRPKIEDVPLEMIGQLIASLPVDVYIHRIEEVFSKSANERASNKSSKRSKTSLSEEIGEMS
jgi:hypothetical protein